MSDRYLSVEIDYENEAISFTSEAKLYKSFIPKWDIRLESNHNSFGVNSYTNNKSVDYEIK